VLVVDDDRAFRDSLLEYLRELLPEDAVCAVADGNTGFARALEARPTHVLLDQVMPGPNGLEIAHALAQALPSTCVVILSGAVDFDATSLPPGVELIRKDEHLHDRLAALLSE
jgi:DNA-binding NarL/FixJ family response regulator